MTAQAAARVFTGGAQHFWVTKINQAGYSLGTLADVTTPVQDTLYSPHKRSSGFKSIGSPSVTSATVSGSEGNRLIAQMDIGASPISPFDLTFGINDETFQALVTGGTVDITTYDGVTVTGMDTGQVTPPALRFCITVQAKDDGSWSGFDNYFWNNVQMRWGGQGASEATGEDPNPLTFTITPQESDRDPMGGALTTIQQQRMVTRVRSSYPMFTETYIGDNSTTTTTLSYLPIYSTATGASDNFVMVNGVATSVTSINTSTGVVTFSSAPAADAIVQITYQTSYVAP